MPTHSVCGILDGIEDPVVQQYALRKQAKDTYV